MSVLDNFQDWKNFLSQRVEQAQGMGMDKETITDVAQQIGNYLAKEISPQNSQERLLQELWNAADEQEQKTIAGLMVKLVHGGEGPQH
ncbi:hypothetical protein GCM10007416_04330 [Kroppenstedtia guangzhouensis]|uniref:DUF3243 domain-containing protein n=1 Tax=Kroppenstedtia guangzhouensis TaxID=1274356 RepID=A0ABQ1FZQ0_9BACL|nr:DUF3243 domain-containing protein [Kroppenstedtia guangzhouensis]GGA34609.1 hypothetical protein GCM10007416_04330 [Kroppenstedtia guangzhouensis]